MSPSLSSKHSINLHEPSLQTPCGPLFFSLSPQKMVLLFKFLVSTAKIFIVRNVVCMYTLLYFSQVMTLTCCAGGSFLCVHVGE